MTPRTGYTDILQATGWSLREWHRRSGVSLNTLRKISAGDRGRPVHPQRRTRAALAAALREAADDYHRLADTLDPA
jgi:hypothetical protein